PISGLNTGAYCAADHSDESRWPSVSTATHFTVAASSTAIECIARLARGMSMSVPSVTHANAIRLSVAPSGGSETIDVITNTRDATKARVALANLEFSSSHRTSPASTCPTIARPHA